MPKPRKYDLAQRSEIDRLLYEVHGYLQVSVNDGTDRLGREYALDGLDTLLRCFDLEIRYKSIRERFNESKTAGARATAWFEGWLQRSWDDEKGVLKHSPPTIFDAFDAGWEARDMYPDVDIGEARKIKKGKLIK